MLFLNHDRNLTRINIKQPHLTSTKPIEEISKENVLRLSNSTFTTLSDPRLMELELTPKAKIYIKATLSPFAAFSYTLQKASIALDQTITGSVTLLIFSLMNSFSSSSFGAYEVKLPILGICLVGSIVGVRKVVKSIRKIILSIPAGVRTCSANIFREDCSIFEFISGVDKTKKKSFKSKLKKLVKW